MEVLNELLVRRALAAHLDVAVDEFTSTQALEEDLGLDPLDLVLIGLRFESDAGVEFPVAELEHVKTVGDLDALVQTWLDDTRPTLPAFHSPLSFDTATEAFFVQPFQAPEPVGVWPSSEEDDVRQALAEHRRRAYKRWVAVLVAGSVGVLAAAWLPLLGG